MLTSGLAGILGTGLLRRSRSGVDVFTGSAASSILHLRFGGPLRLFPYLLASAPMRSPLRHR